MPRSADTARWMGFLCLGITILGWALNWPAMKLLLQEWPPLFSRGIAGLAASLLLAALALQRGERLSVPSSLWPRLFFAAFTNVFAWMGFGTVMMQWLRVGEGALLVYTMPIWAMLLAWPILGTRPTVRTGSALILGIAGICVLLSGQGFEFGPEKVWGIALGLAAAILFALGSILNRTPWPLPPLALVAWQVGLGCLPMVLLGLAFEWDRIGPLSPRGWLLMANMTLFPMGLCYVTWFAALRALPPATASIGTLMVPVIGLISAASILGEPLGLREAIAVVLTLGGVTIALRAA